jgi:hypothetical protein
MALRSDVCDGEILPVPRRHHDPKPPAGLRPRPGSSGDRSAAYPVPLSRRRALPTSRQRRGDPRALEYARTSFFAILAAGSACWPLS